MAKLAGVPDKVITRARQILSELEAEGAVQEGAAALQEKTALMPDYDYADGEGNGTSTAGVVGSALTFTLAGGVGLALAAAKKRRAKQRAAEQG